MSGLDDFYDDLEDQRLADFEVDEDGDDYVDAMDTLFDIMDDSDDDEYQPDDDDYADPDVNMDEDDEDEEDDDDDDGARMYVVDAEDDQDDDVEEVTVDPAHFLELISLFNSGGSADARASLISRLLNGSGGGGTFRFAPPQTAAERASERRRRRWWTPQTEPHPNGVALLRSGDFGPTGPWKPSGKHSLRPSERHTWRAARARAARRPLAEPTIPNTPGTVVAEYPTVPYVGQFCGPDYGVFCECDSRLAHKGLLY